MIIFCIYYYLIIYFLFKALGVVDLNTTLYQLEKEKELRASLFKITHEIKNPIAVCKGYLDLMDINKDKKDKYISIIKSEINRTIILMDDFLDYTKVNLNKEELDLYMLLEEVKDCVYPLMRQNNVKTEFLIPDDEVYIEADYNRLKQVLINVLKNSLETKDKENMNIILNTFLKKDYIIIKIKDNGSGMDKETLDNIGKMFYTTKIKGTGLGVSLSKEIIKLHDGNMKYESIPGKGTTVSITLPLKSM